MRLIYTKDGFSKNEKEEWRVIIFNNILDGLRMTIDAMEEFGISFGSENTTVRADRLLLQCAVASTNISIAEPCPYNHAGKGSEALRANTNSISASLQGLVEGSGNSEGD